MSSTVYGVYCPNGNCMGLYVSSNDAAIQCNELNGQKKNLVYFQANTSSIIDAIQSKPYLVHLILSTLNLTQEVYMTSLGVGQEYTVQEKTIQ
jgi:hypothetical protein